MAPAKRAGKPKSKSKSKPRSRAKTATKPRKAAKARVAKRAAAGKTPRRIRRTAMPRRVGLPGPGPLPSQYVGQIALFGFNFAPDGWAACQGQFLPISQYVPLFEVIGATYGGNGHTDFMLPKLAPLRQGPAYYIALEGTFPQQQ